jgi:hypothetical protein
MSGQVANVPNQQGQQVQNPPKNPVPIQPQVAQGGNLAAQNAAPRNPVPQWGAQPQRGQRGGVQLGQHAPRVQNPVNNPGPIQPQNPVPANAPMNNAVPPQQLPPQPQVAQGGNLAAPQNAVVNEPGTPDTEVTGSQAAETQPDDAMDAWVRRVLQIETPGPYRSTPLKTKALPDKYDGEDTRMGFRAELLPQELMEQHAASYTEQMRKHGKPRVYTADDAREIVARTRHEVTRYHTPEQQAATEVSFDETGGAYNQSGTSPVQTGKLLQTLSPEGKLHATPPSRVVRMPDGSETPYIMGVPIPKGGQLVNTHHSTLLAGGDVAGAGHIHVEDEHIIRVDDQSGHYKPDANMTHQAVAEIAAQGGLVDRRVVDASQTPIDAATFGRISPELGTRAQAQDALMARIQAAQPGDDIAALIQQHRREAALLHAAARTAIEALSAEDRAQAGLQGVGSGNREARVDLMDKRAGITDDEFAAMRSLPEAERAAAIQDRAKLNQLKAPLGEAVFARLQTAATVIRLMRAALDAGGDKLATAMKKAGVDTPEAFTEKMNAVRKRLGADSIQELQQKLGVDDIASLKAELGEAMVAAYADDDAAKQRLYAKHGVKDIEMANVEINSQPNVNFEIGRVNALNLATGQFLQTGGNEAQARNKRALHGEIVAEVARREAAREEQNRIRRMANEGILAAGGAVPPRAAPRAAPMGAPDGGGGGGDQIGLRDALRDGFDGDGEDHANQRRNDDDDLLG